MLDIKQIEAFFPEPLRAYKKNLLREYLQWKLIEVIGDSPNALKMAFMGGTAIHILHGNNRFSEDLDFDNLGLNQKDFYRLVEHVKKRISLLGYEVETKIHVDAAFRVYLKFPWVLYENKISRHKKEKLIIQIDMEPQNFPYEPEKKIISKFDVFLRIQAVPEDLLLSQKILCVFKRPRLMGKDFYDIVFLLGKIRPNYAYLVNKLNIQSPDDLKKRLIKKCQNVDFEKLARDVRPFLFNPDDTKKVLYFPDYIKELEFR
ncbi:MAG: nucleotidyl transferase AbiEii/AbiGii toxin family protein [Candidatus Aminicenantales bacterium]